ncbi:DUF6542 domain-containing protein [Embleya sp. NPDC020886]|uniref:DUF6542 domain-containing protein n=1 Tax=Embleya sp. NPDC020886 TaxID=3363980 RepID=UPI0037A0C9C3
MRRRPDPSTPPPPETPGAGGEQARDRSEHRPARAQARPRRPVPPRRANGVPGGSRPSGGGLTVAGAAVFGFGGTLLGGLVDHLATDGLGFVFGFAFLISSVFVAWKVRARDWLAAVITPPIAFAATVLIVSTLLGADSQESYLTRVGLDLITALSFKAGLLWGGTALAGAVALVKRRAADQP